MESNQPSAAAEALLWLRLSRVFSAEAELWRLADIVGLISRNGCSGVGTVVISRIDPNARDENNLCQAGGIEATIIDHAVIPLLAPHDR
jgi:hypothetical protein